MRAVSFDGPDDVRLVDVPRPVPGEGEALVRVEASALCGSELHAARGSNPGHEAAGIVEHAPPGSPVAVGERAGISAVTGCGACETCRRGVQIHCPVARRVAVDMHADYVAVPASALRPVPAGTSPRDAVLISGDALGVPVRGQRRVPSAPGERVVVLGAGPVGMGHVLVRAHLGAEVVVIEPSPFRRELARTLGASAVYEPGEDVGPAPGLVIECTGIPACVQQALALVAPGGTVLQSGVCPAVEVRPTETFVVREVTYTGAFYYADEDYPEIVRLYEDGLAVERMVTHELPADEAAAAYRTFVGGESGKVVLRWS